MYNVISGTSQFSDGSARHVLLVCVFSISHFIILFNTGGGEFASECASEEKDTIFVVGYRRPCKMQSQLPPQPRKSSSKCLEAVFEVTKTPTAVNDQASVWKNKSSKVQSKQMSSTPVDHNANELHCLPVSSFYMSCYW